MALGDMDCDFAWQAWRLRHWVGTRDAWSALRPRDFAWQVRHLVTRTLTLRGRRGTYLHMAVTSFADRSVMLSIDVACVVRFSSRLFLWITCANEFVMFMHRHACDGMPCFFGMYAGMRCSLVLITGANIIFC